jgi:predicted RNA binding protein YcfA (HicA-like mRNA interferase family)
VTSSEKALCMPAMKVREVMRMLERDGWEHVSTTGGHRHLKHPTKRGRVTVSGHLGDDMPKGTMASILRQAGIRRGV